MPILSFKLFIRHFNLLLFFFYLLLLKHNHRYVFIHIVNELLVCFIRNFDVWIFFTKLQNFINVSLGSIFYS